MFDQTALSCRNVVVLKWPDAKYMCLSGAFLVEADGTATCCSCKRNWKISDLRIANKGSMSDQMSKGGEIEVQKDTAGDYTFVEKV
jgi:hypothetical protein